jgi:hypothetical protein
MSSKLSINKINYAILSILGREFYAGSSNQERVSNRGKPTSGEEI